MRAIDVPISMLLRTQPSYLDSPPGFPSALAQPAEFDFTPTTSGTFYGQATVNGVPANANDWIAAFDNWATARRGTVVMNDGLAINLPIYGDDMTTSTTKASPGRAVHLEPGAASKHLDLPWL